MNAAVELLLSNGTVDATTAGAPTVDLAAAESLTLPNLSRYFEARLQALPTAVLELLEAASAEGEKFHPHLLVPVLGAGEIQTYRGLRQLRSTGDWLTDLAEPSDSLGEVEAFFHALLRDHVYARLSLGERRALHSAFAELIAGLPSILEDRREELLAYHFTQADRPSDALRHALSAARHDLAVGSYDLAWTCLKPLIGPLSSTSEALSLAAVALTEMGQALQAMDVLGPK